MFDLWMCQAVQVISRPIVAGSATELSDFKLATQIRCKGGTRLDEDNDMIYTGLHGPNQSRLFRLSRIHACAIKYAKRLGNDQIGMRTGAQPQLNALAHWSCVVRFRPTTSVTIRMASSNVQSSREANEQFGVLSNKLIFQMRRNHLLSFQRLFLLGWC